MDTSKEYILMCEKAEEIQKIKQSKIADQHDYGVLKNKDDDLGIWLPRQDQLQEMTGHKPAYANAGLFYHWLKDNCYFHYTRNSMEQLWLAFAMKEKHQKVWKGMEWQCITKK